MAKVKFEYTKTEVELRCKTFVDVYLTNGFDAEAAAISAGYDKQSADKIARYLLTKPEVMRELRRRTKRVAEKYTITQDMIFEELEDAYSMAVEQRNPAAMIAATTKKAQLAGIMLEKPPGVPIELSLGVKEMDVLERIAQLKKGNVDALLQ